MPDLNEPTIAVRSREELLYLLAEAAEIEHNLMCCYLYAAFGLKTSADGLSEVDAAEVGGWRRAITHVAVDEMTHLALVANLTAAVGGAPPSGRPNFPIGADYHPSGVIVHLTPLIARRWTSSISNDPRVFRSPMERGLPRPRPTTSAKHRVSA